MANMENMAQEVQGSTESTTQNLTSTESRSNAPETNERTFRQSELNEIVGRAKHDAVESYKRRQEQSQVRQESNYGSINEESYRKIAAEEAQRLRDEYINETRQKAEAEYAQKIVDSYFQKVESGKSKYDDFDKVTEGIEITEFPNVVHLLAEAVDNSGDILYELGKNRLALLQLELLSQKSPKDALVHIKRLSQSIKDNEEAAKARTANAPLSQLRPSSYGTDSGAPLSVSDYRKKYRV
jgi:hypothetical protein